jgi:exodeoxyribonuclease V
LISRSDLSPDQRSVYESMLDWTNSERGTVLTVGGFAGTGKSTLLSLFASEVSLKTAYICFTGRASSVLDRKLNAAGVGTTNRSQTDDDRKLDGDFGHLFYSPMDDEASRPFCGTIHRLLYRPFIDSETEELLGWEKREELDRDYDLVVIDEASMVDSRIVADILQHGVRILAVGDHGQLPPVMGEGTLMANPHLRLEKIHRQAEGSPIIQLSRILREEGRLARELADNSQLRFGSTRDILHPSLATMLSQHKLDAAVLCWRNATRIHVNRTVRGHMGYAGKPPQPGEPLIALKNYPPVYNGMRGLLTEETTPSDEWWRLRAKIEFPDEGIPEEEHEICRDQFHRARPFDSVDELKAAGMRAFAMSHAGRFFDFGYAMTIHKSQGSQFKHAVVMVDWKQNYDNENTRRLAYTAITRASEKLSVLT